MHFPRPDPQRAAEFRAHGYWGDLTIPQCIAASCAAMPQKYAVRDASGRGVCYADLDNTANKIAGYLSDQGVRPGDIITVCLPNWVETVEVFLAVMRLGAVVNPVPVTYGRADLAYVLEKCRSKALFLPVAFRGTDYATLLDALLPTLSHRPSVIQVGEGVSRHGVPLDAVKAQRLSCPQVVIHADDPVAVLFTSGTESKPKGAVHTHNTILFGERALAQTLGFTASDVAFMASPVAHTTGFMHGVVMTLMLGGTLSLLDIFTGESAVNQMHAHGANWTMGATPFLADVAAVLKKRGERLPALRYFLCGGAPIPEVLVRRAGEVDLRVLSIYGATESPPHTVVYPEDPEENSWTTDGRPLAGIAVRIVDPSGRDLPQGEIGEEWSRGPNTFLGYFDDAEKTARDFDADGWYHSGDLARLLPDGSIRISGRLKDIIVRGGQNISVREVEDYLIAHPAIAMVSVVGIPHGRLGETGCAVVVLKPGASLTLAELTAFLIDKGIARFKLPEWLEIWPELPQTPSGKIQKFLIRKALQDKKVGVGP